MSHGPESTLIDMVSLIGGFAGISSAIYFHLISDRFVPGEYTLFLASFGLALIASSMVSVLTHDLAFVSKLISSGLLITMEMYVIFRAWAKSEGMPKESDLKHLQ